MVKKILMSFLTVIMALGLTLPASAANIGGVSPQNFDVGGGGSYPYAGAKKTETVYISNSTLAVIGGLPAAGATLSPAKLKQAIIDKLGRFHPIAVKLSAGAIVLSGINHLAGYNGYKITFTSTYVVNKRVFDGTVWVNYTGWGTPSAAISRY